MAEVEPMRGKRARKRSCSIHGDNGCEMQGESGPLTRADEKRIALADAEDEQAKGTVEQCKHKIDLSTCPALGCRIRRGDESLPKPNEPWATCTCDRTPNGHCNVHGRRAGSETSRGDA